MIYNILSSFSSVHIYVRNNNEEEIINLGETWSLRHGIYIYFHLTICIYFHTCYCRCWPVDLSMVAFLAASTSAWLPALAPMH